MKNKIILFLVTLSVLLVPVTAFAQEYGSDYPNYVDFSGGAYIEVQSTLGRGSLVFQNTYKSGYFGFYGSDYNVCNLSNSTITGRYITASGKEYNARCSSFGVAQYYYDSGVTREWRDLNITKIYNTNVDFIDDTDLKRHNLNQAFTNPLYVNFTIIALLMVFIIIHVFHWLREGKA